VTVAEKQIGAVIGVLLFGALLGCAGSQGQNGTSSSDELDRKAKSAEDLLYDLKKYHRLQNRGDELKETRAALTAMGRPVVGRLCEAMRDTDRYDRYARGDIAKVLGEIGDPQAVGVLFEAIAEPEGPGVESLARALEDVGFQDIEPLIALLEGDDPQSQSRAMSALWCLEDPRAVELLLVVFQNPPTVHARGHAADTLAAIGDRRAVEPLLQAIKDGSDPDVIHAAARALGQLGDPRAVEPLIAIMNRAPEKWASSIVGPLGGLQDPRAVEPLLALIDKPNDVVAERAIAALGQIGGKQAAIGLLESRRTWQGKSTHELRAAGFSPYHLLHLEQALVATGEAAVDLLLAELNDPKSPIRIVAARLLGEIGDRRAVDPLLAATGERDYDLRSQAIDALGRLGDPRVAARIAAFLDNNASALNAARALASLQPPAYDPLYKALKHESWDVRVEAARALGEQGDGTTLATLIELYPRENIRDEYALSRPGQVRRSILQAFRESGTGEHVPFLIEALKDPEVEVRREAVYPLGRIGDPRAVPALIKLLNDPRPLVVKDAAIALGKIGDARAVGPLVKLLARQATTITYEMDGPDYSGGITRRRTFWENSDAEEALIQIGGPSVRPLLRELKGSRSNARCGAIRVLGRLRDRRAVEPLIRALGDKDPEIRILAAAALAQIGDGRAVGPLLKMAADQTRGAESSAATAALWALGLEAIDPLIAALDDTDEKIRQHATQALKTMGEPRAWDAVEARTCLAR
jgi:HEAT repeat protein